MTKTDPQDPKPKTTPAPTPAAVPEPATGGNYLRDPITGAITLNPAHTGATE
jgi:hypothetical protein